MRWKPILFIILCGVAGIAIYLSIPRRPGNSLPPPDAGSGVSQLTTSAPSASRASPPVPGINSTPSTPSVPATNVAFAPSSAPAPLPPTTPYLLGSADAPPSMEPAIVLSNMRIVINQYGSRFNGNPVGTNEEITRALNGENPGQVKFINPDSGLRINGRGELVDYWGTPFFFHQLSGTEMEIHSAGPDRIMFTPDDLVTR